MRSTCKRSRIKGTGLIGSILNKTIDKLPFEAHIPTYHFCGPGTKLKQRLEAGDQGINALDRACREHDIAYNESIGADDYSTLRKEADEKLEKAAWNRVKASDSSLSEKAAALLVTGGMKVKRKFGGSHQRRGPTGLRKKRGKIRGSKKSGGFLPLVLAGLGALGSVVSGGIGVAKGISEIRNRNEQLAEIRRHNLAMERKGGSGLYLRPYKQQGGSHKKRKMSKKKAR